MPVIAIAGLLAGCGEPDSAPNEGAMPPAADDVSDFAAGSKSAALTALIDQFVDTRRENDERTGLREVSVQAFLDDIAEDRRLLDELRQVSAEGLSPEERIDRKLMIGILESETHSAEQRRMWENDPSIYVPARQVGVLLEPQSDKPARARAAELREILARVPDRLATGRRNLKQPPRRFTEAGIFGTAGTIESLRADTANLVDRLEGQDEGLRQSVDTAVAALQEYEQFLREDLLPRSTGEWAIGKEHYDYILQHRWFLDADADDILARGRKAFEETEALAQEVGERIDPGKHWSEVYESLKDDHPPADGIKEAYQRQIDAAQAFVIEQKIVTLPAGERVITVDTPPAMRRSSPFGTFQSVDQFGDGLEGKLVLTPIEDWMSGEQQKERLRSHHNAWIPIIAVHEAYPGHHVDALKTRENPRVLRKVVREPIFSEGWGLFTEELMYEQGFLTGDDVRLTQLRNRLWRAARVILDVSLHTGRMTFEEAVDFLSEKVRFERYAAELEVGMYTVRPTYVLGYLIGMQEIARIRDEYIARYGEPSPPSEFYDQLLRVGSIPPVLARESLFGPSPDEQAAVNR
jgi:uncharacterized protein (DUF885 family)